MEYYNVGWRVNELGGLGNNKRGVGMMVSNKDHTHLVTVNQPTSQWRNRRLDLPKLEIRLFVVCFAIRSLGIAL